MVDTHIAGRIKTVDAKVMTMGGGGAHFDSIGQDLLVFGGGGGGGGVFQLRMAGSVLVARKKLLPLVSQSHERVKIGHWASRQEASGARPLRGMSSGKQR